MRRSSPSIVIIAGPNGAGKSTAGPALLRDLLGIRTVVNADRIAEGLSAFSPETVAIAAGRVMLDRIHRLIAQRKTFAFETTLASRTFAPRIKECVKSGYDFHLVFLWLPNASFAIQRVKNRVKSGGHSVPDATIRRRYESGLRNFFRLYKSMATSWRLYDNSPGGSPRLIALGSGPDGLKVRNPAIWRKICKDGADEED